MYEELDNANLERLAKVGSSDADSEVGTQSVGTTIVASILYCSEAISTITSILTSSLNIFNIFVLQYLTEAVISNNKETFIFIIGVMITLTLLINLINMIANYKFQPFMKNRISKKIQEDIYMKSFDYSISDFENKDFYDLYYFVLENTKDITINMITQFSTLLTSILSIGGVSSIILRYDLYTILCVIIGVSVSTMLSLNIQKLQYKFKLDTISSARKIKYIERIFYLFEYVKKIKIIKIII